MLEPPWRDTRSQSERDIHLLTWLLGWAWALAGLVGGALVAPALVQFAGLSDTLYQDWLLIGVALLPAFLVQLGGWSLMLLLVRTPRWSERQLLLVFYPVASLPLIGVGYGLYRYFTWVDADQRSVTVAFVGGLLVKTFLIPLIKGIVTGAFIK